MMTGFGWYGGFGMVLMGLFWIGLIVLSVWLVAKLFPQMGSTGGRVDEPTALDILQRRYARGDMTAEEYATMRRELEGKQ